MKLLCSVVLGCALAAGESADDSADRFVGYDYGSYGYQADYDAYGNKKKNNYGYDNTYSVSSDPYPSDPYGYDVKNEYAQVDYATSSSLRDNGLKCWACNHRLSADITETSTVNVFSLCGATAGGATQKCHGEERVCLTETRARYDRVVEIHAGCKSPDACVALWRRNERYTLPFMLYGSYSSATAALNNEPVFMNDECDVYTSDANRQKFVEHRSQYESVCRHCCVATAATNCNFVAGTVSPMITACTTSTNCATAAALTQSAFPGYNYADLALFMKTALNSVTTGTTVVANYPMPVEGRNSVPMEKFGNRQNGASAVLKEQADLLSMENTDFQDKRHAYT